MNTPTGSDMGDHMSTDGLSLPTCANAFVIIVRVSNVMSNFYLMTCDFE